MVTIYLAGAIRDGHLEDVSWREELIEALAYKNAKILNPLGDKTFNLVTGEWRVSTIRTNQHGIVGQDLWCVRRSDIVVANLLSLAEGYPSIGTLMELGAGAALNKLIYSIVAPGFTGVSNPGVFPGVHPFISEVSTEMFPDVLSLIAFLEQHVEMLAGWAPKFGGVVGV